MISVSAHGRRRTGGATAMLALLAALTVGCQPPHQDPSMETALSQPPSTEDVQADAQTIGPGEFEVLVGKWSVEEDGERTVLEQQAASADAVFNLALARATARDLQLSVRLAAVSGEVDQGGGVVWRAQGKGDYYIARYNPLESNFRVYYVKGGVRKQLGTAKVDTDVHAWHTLSIAMTGDHITCSLDGKILLDVHDGTFPDAGRVGLWTKADAVTRFGVLELVSLDG